MSLRLIKYWLPVIVACTVIFVQSSYPSPDSLPDIPYLDKCLHFLVYAILSALFCRAFSATTPLINYRLLLIFISILCATAYGGSDEWHQSMVSYRHADLWDLFADFIGSIFGTLLYVKLFLISRNAWLRV